MIPSFAYLTLAIAFLLAVYGLVMSVWGVLRKSQACIESSRLALLMIFPLISISLLALLILLFDNRFDVVYVYRVSSLDLPAFLKLTALWGGQSGSLLFWSWLAAGFSALFSIRMWKRDWAFFSWSLVIIFVILVFFLSLNALLEIPFERLWLLPDGGRVISVFQPWGARPLVPQDGQGLNPLLRHPGMIWHPPALYVGFVGFMIPFVLAVSSLAVGRKDSQWLVLSRPWALTAWVFLTLGLVLGMRWAYDVLGWGGYWGWDPVEIAALLPWLSATAFIHTALIQRRNRGFRRWNLLLIILTFSLVIFGTFLTRSGVLSSVHTFTGSEIGLPLFIFTAILTLGALGLIIFRWQSFRSAYIPEFKFSKEVMSIFSNLILLSILGVSLLGVVYPIFSKILTGTSISVGSAWYERINGPLLLLLLLLTGICPLVAWSGARLKNPGKVLLLLVPLSLIIPLLAWLVWGIRSLYVLTALWLAGGAALVMLGDYLNGVILSWRRGKRKWFSALLHPFGMNRMRTGGLLVHLGVVLIGIGIIGIEGLQQELQVSLNVGASAELGGYQFIYQGLEPSTNIGSLETTRAVLHVTRNGAPVGTLYPQRQIFYSMGLAVTQPAIKSSLARDIYVMLVDWDTDMGDAATFLIYINPLINWLWIGAGVLTLGTVLAVWPRRLEENGKKV